MKKLYIVAALLFTLCCSLTAREPGRKDTADLIVFSPGTEPKIIEVGYNIKQDNPTNFHSISYIDETLLSRFPEVDVKKALYGNLAGLNVMQGVGRPSDNTARMRLRGFTPLVLVDGFPRDINSITIPEIKSITLLKDATAAAIYGVRGANGVINVVTKRGRPGKLKIKGNYQYGMNTKFRSPEFSDSYTYAQSLNKALALDGLNAAYTNEELEAFRTGQFSYAYPNIDWQSEVYKDLGTNHQLNLTFDGGSEKFRYFSALVYSNDQGMFSNTKSDPRYDASLYDVRLNLRTNLDVDISQFIKFRLDVLARLQEVNSPNGLRNIYNAIYRTPASAFPIKNEEGVFGGNNIYGSNNPVALVGSNGHFKSIRGTTFGNMQLTADLSSITPGLSAYAAISMDNMGSSWENSSKTYRYVDLQPSIVGSTVITEPVYFGADAQVISHGNGFSNMYVNSSLRGQLTYEKSIVDHAIAISGIYDQQSTVVREQNRSQKRQSAIGYVTYSFRNRYFLQSVLSYSGSAVFPEGDRFETYPSISLAWDVSNEPFFNSNIIDGLKLRMSYGVSGFDGTIAHDLDVQSYVGSAGYYFGSNIAYAWGMREGNLPIEGLTTEKSRKGSVGIDLLAIGNRLNLMIEGYSDRRYDLLVSSINSVSGVIGIGVPLLNEGIQEYKGVDLQLGWQDEVGEFSYRLNGNYSFMRSKIIDNNEAFQQYDYLYREGNRVGQSYGLEAIDFFESQVQINNSPVHSFATVRPGDIMYKDQNGDNIIDDQDIVKMFHTNFPEVYYGFSLDLSYKRFGLYALFQGVANFTVNLLRSPLYRPLVEHSTVSDTFLGRETPWSPETGDNATVPRLTTQDNRNNYRNNSLWFRDGKHLKLRNVRVYYDVPTSVFNMKQLRLYAAGTNLLSIDEIEFTDPEQLGANYPALRSYWVGAKINF